jgi:uncharacterized protein (TIGR03084 family)
MDGIVDALEAQQAELTGLLESLDDAGWTRPSPCDGWDVADVVLHLVQTNLMAEASLADALDAFYEDQLSGTRTAVDVDDGAAAMVEAHRGAPNAELLERWRSGAARLTAQLRAQDPSRRVAWVAGTLSARTLSTTRLAETWIHTGDVAAALGVDQPPSDRLEHIARLAWRTIPYAFERAGRALHGPVAFLLTGPDGQDWSFQPEEPAATTVRGPAADLCAVAGRRTDPAATALAAEGPDAAAILELVRTYA